MGSDDSRNLIVAAVLSMAVVFGWYALFPPAPPPPPEAPPSQSVDGTAPAGQTTVVTQGADGEAAPAIAQTREGALTSNARVMIESDAITGSISLKGGRLDDLHLTDYRETLDPGADTVILLNPTGGPTPYYSVWGWLRTADGDPGPLPGANTPWQVPDGATLTPESPVTMVWDNGEGLRFSRTFAVDERYMFTVTQAIENTTGETVTLAPYGYIARRGLPDLTGFYILHEGAVATIDGELVEIDYDDMEELPPNALEGGRAEAREVAEGGWLGFTDKYWMATLVGQPGQVFDAVFKSIQNGGQVEYRTEMRMPVMTIEPGQTSSVDSLLFAGAKEVSTIKDYQSSLGIAGFEDSVDWGWFYFLTKPIFSLLAWINGIIGNMGWSIIMLTLIIKAVLFPLAYKSYVSMGKMKQLQPEMEKIKERVGDDKQKMQQEMLALYKREKVNPASGCLPILLQIPIFFALYKVIFVTIEMRHAPFIGWIEDLSAPDPTSFINLFGLMPWDAPDPTSIFAIFSIGFYPILMGVTMWLQQKLNPAPTDPTQAMIFAWMPWVFMFMLGQFDSGLVIYWCANNIITFVQQYAIMRSQGVEVDLLGNIRSSFKRLRGSDEKKDAANTPSKPAEIDEDEDDAPEEAPRAKSTPRKRSRKR